MYTELQVTTNFSFLRGASHPEELVTQAAALGYKAIAISDLNSLAGVVRGHSAAKKAGIKLIVASRITLCEELSQTPLDKNETPRELGYSHLTSPAYLPLSLLLYPTTRAAYGKLCRLLTLGKSRAPKGACYLTIEDLKIYHQELIAIAVPHQLDDLRLRPSLEQLQNIFDEDRLSLAITKLYSPTEKKQLAELVALSNELSIPLAATNDVYAHCAERKKLLDVLACIRLSCTIKEAGFQLFENAERHLKSPQEMKRLFAAYPRTIKRSQQIAKAALNFSLDELHYEYPKEICPEGKSPLEYLVELTREGAKKRYPKGVPKNIIDQVNHELRLIKELNYAKYFLTVYDIVRFATEKGILHQGRGAAANSAVCYMLGITAVNPDKIQLLLERFISKERNEPPDIDIDFEHERREEVIQYIYSKYGRMRAALTAEVITYRTKSAVRDVGKALGLSLDVIQAMIKMITRAGEETLSDEDFTKAGLNPHDPLILTALELSSEIHGFPRHLSQHVGGFVISNTPLCEIVPIENAAMADRTVIEWDKDDIEIMGMLKVDVLALGMLTCIRKALGLINESEKRISHEELLLHNIPADDPLVYDMICRADTIGVFQIESRAQMSMLPRLRPRCFYDLVIEVAIVRPGPIQGGMVHPFLKRRNGEERITYPNPKIKKILERTLGVPIFQEQVMELCVTAAGFTPGKADNLRRALASWKRNKDAIKKLGEEIINGMLANGYSRNFAERCFNQIKGFASYGFPQSHAASFALLVYVSSWLKKHHPAAFAAGLLNSQPMGFYQPAQIIGDAKAHGVKVLPIDVNHSSWDCTLEDKGKKLRLGTRLVKGFSKKDADVLQEAILKNGAQNSILQLWRNSTLKVSALRTLAAADTFQSMGLNRQEALWQIRKLRDEALPLFEKHQEKKEIVTLPPFTISTHVNRDYQSTGFSLKAHPLSFYRQSLKANNVICAYELLNSALYPQDSRVSVAGMVLVRQRPGTASGIVFMTIEDETGIVNIVLHSKIFKQYQWVICDNEFLIVHGKIQRQGEVIHLIADYATTLSNSSENFPSMSRDFH